MPRQTELRQEREYTAYVQQVLYQVIAQSQQHASFQNETIRMMLTDAWEELRMRPTALSPQDLDQLNPEIDRFLARRSFSEGRAEQYEKMLLKPFFARVDFREDGENGAEKIVIGLYSLKGPDGSLLVHDWRAPVSTLYYDSLPGSAAYESPSGIIRGEMTLKRQYCMENGRLKYYVDTEYSIDDGMLLDILSGATSRHMRNIVSTIQQEQNAAIRFEKSRVLSVTGGAGSGKTSVAMHRAAFLLHRHREHLSSKDMVVLSPSDAFTEYISTVLPELGEENTRTATLPRLLAPLTGRPVESPARQYDVLLADEDRRKAIDWLHGPKYTEALDMYIEKLHGYYPRFRTIALDKHVLATARELQRLYQVDNAPLTPAQRLMRIKNMLESRLKDWEASFYPQYERQFISSYKGRELEFITRMAVTKRLHPLRALIKQTLEVSPVSLYLEAMIGTPRYVTLPPRDGNDPIAWEHAPGIAYLMVRLGFARPDTAVKYLLIDEAQDYSMAALRFLSVYYPHAHITLLGDPNQRTLAGLSPCRAESWGSCFGEPDAPILRLSKSYRSTQEITAFCDSLLPEEDTPECVGRSGGAVIQMDYDPQAVRALLDQWREKGHTRIALIARSTQDALRLHKDFPSASFLEDEDDSVKEGVSVCACHTTKGLEFDAVCVVWPTVAPEKDEMRRLYTACSRALHALCLCQEEKHGL